MSSWPLHCRRHFRLLPVVSNSVRSQLEFTVLITGPKVFVTSPVCSGVRQRALTCGGEVAPFITVVEVTFHCPGSIRFSATAGTVESASAHNNVIPNPIIRWPLPVIVFVGRECRDVNRDRVRKRVALRLPPASEQSRQRKA